MAAIRETLELSDNFSQTFRNFDAAANASITVAEEFQRALMEFSEGFLDGLVDGLQESRDELAGMNGDIETAANSERNFKNEINNAKREIDNAGNSQSNFTKEVQNTEIKAFSLVGTLGKVAGAIGAVSLVKNFIETSDEMSQITAKLNLINDGTRTTAELQDAIFNSAQRARGSYADTANLVARLGMNAKDAFSSNKEMLQFAENLNKSFKIAGASAQEQASVILQMSQALASGVLRGQEFNAVMSGAPNVMRNVAEYMGVSVGALRDMAAEGEITAQVVKDALLSATDTINYQFEQIPITFSDIMTTAKNKLVDGMGEVFNKWAEKLGEADIQDAVDKVTTALLTLMEVGGEALVKIAEGIGWISDNWEALEPIILTATSMILAYKATCVTAAGEVTAAWAEANATIGAAGGVEGLSGIAGSPGGLGMLFTFGAYNAFKNAGETAVGAQEYMQQQLERKEAEAHAEELKAQALRDLNESIRVAEKSKEYADRYGKTLDNLTDAFNRNVEFNKKAQWYYDYYTKEPSFHYAEEQQRIQAKAQWYKDYYGKGEEKVEVATVDEVERINGDVKLSEEDLRIFRDIAENKYVANVELQTLAPQIAVNIENATGATPDELADILVAKIEEEMNERTAISH